jgi:VanZ family protein
MRIAAPFIVFLAFLGLWTWKLLEPRPVPEEIEHQIPSGMKFTLAKSLHAGAYAFLTVLAAFLPVRRVLFWAVVTTLALHGIGTEIGQTYVPNRHGCVRDVIIDWIGIGLGLAGLWGCGFSWRDSSKSATPSN